MNVAEVNIPVAVLIWLMIVPMLLKIDFGALAPGRRALARHRRHARHQLAGQAVLAWRCSAGCSSAGCSGPGCRPGQIDSYIAGLILLAAAPCTAMVFVWSNLTDGEPHFTLSQVALNDTIMVFAFAPIVGLLLGLSAITVPWDTLFLSVVLYIVVPVIAAQLWRRALLRARRRGRACRHAAPAAAGIAGRAAGDARAAVRLSGRADRARSRSSSRCSRCRSSSRSISTPASPTGSTGALGVRALRRRPLGADRRLATSSSWRSPPRSRCSASSPARRSPPWSACWSRCRSCSRSCTSCCAAAAGMSAVPPDPARGCGSLHNPPGNARRCAGDCHDLQPGHRRSHRAPSRPSRGRPTISPPGSRPAG